MKPKRIAGERKCFAFFSGGKLFKKYPRGAVNGERLQELGEKYFGKEVMVRMRDTSDQVYAVDGVLGEGGFRLYVGGSEFPLNRFLDSRNIVSVSVSPRD